jgi:hypothetical protein
MVKFKINLMKTVNTSLIMLFLFLPVFFISCSKEENEALKRNTALLIDKSWKFDSYGLDENNNGIIEASENFMLACEADDSFHFYADGTGFFDGGTSPCSLDEPAITNFQWSFSNNGTELAVFAAPEKINRLDENILEVYYMDVNSMGQPVKFIRRFMH